MSTAGFARLKKLPTIEQYKKILEEAAEEEGYEGMDKITNPIAKLFHDLELYQSKPTFKRARNLWLRFYGASAPPPKEVEAKFVDFLITEDKSVNWPKPKQGMISACIELGEWEREFAETGTELRKEGRKHTAECVRDKMALRRNEEEENQWDDEKIRQRMMKLKKRLSLKQ